MKWNQIKYYLTLIKLKPHKILFDKIETNKICLQQIFF